MEQSQFIHAYSESSSRFAWFLGAGASQSAGLPTAVDVMWDLKRKFYCVEENQQISSNDLLNVAVKEKIAAYLEARGFPRPGDAGEYSACFELIFKDDYERQRRYLKAILSDERISLSIGARILAAMLAANATRVVFTTNFDTVVEQAAASVAGKQISAFHLEGSYAANGALNNDEFPIYVKLHGDFQYRSLKNLEADLRVQDQELGKCFTNACNRFGLVVAGYSGRDDSVMKLLREALAGQNPFSQGLYWTTLKGRALAKPVEDLIAAAKAKGVVAEIVEIETFDSFMSRLWRQLPDRPPELISAVGRQSELTVNIPLPPAGTNNPILRMNALRVTELPRKCLQLHFRTEPQWSDIRAVKERAGDTVICTKQAEVWAWGNEALIGKAFYPNLIDTKEVEVGDVIRDLSSNLFLKSFLEQAIAFGLKREKPLLHRSGASGSTLIVDRQMTSTEALDKLRKIVGGQLHGEIGGLMTSPTEKHPKSEQMAWAEAIHIELQYFEGHYWLLLKPYVWIWPRWARRDASQFLDKRSGGRLNRQADMLLSAWIELLLPTDRHGADHEIFPFDGPAGAGNPRFVINDRTAFSRRQPA